MTHALDSTGRTRVGVIGATGAVGTTMLTALAERGVAPERVRVVASERSSGRPIAYGDGRLEVVPLDERAFDGLDVCLFALGDELAAEWVPRALSAGSVVIDNSATYRLDPDVPLVVPEVNGHVLAESRRLVANPNCSTIVLVMALAPLHRAAGVRRVIGVTFQAASGAGAPATRELDLGARAVLDGRPAPAEVFPRPLAFNCLPQVGGMREDGRSREEWKMTEETMRILGTTDLATSFTCVRVASFNSHAVAAHVELRAPLGPTEAIALWEASPGVGLGVRGEIDDWPTPHDADGRDEVLVGRVRRDPGLPNGLAFWVVGDNLRKGAATNAIQIADAMGLLA